MSDNEAFNVDEFLNASVDAPMDTTYENCPVGQYPGVIDSIKAPKPGLASKKTGEAFYPMDVMWSIQDEGVLKTLGRDKVIVRQTIFLDIIPGKGLDTGKGKNVQLGILREAVGQNVPGWSPGMLVGAGPALLSVTHDTGADGVTRAGVKKVGKI